MRTAIHDGHAWLTQPIPDLRDTALRIFSRQTLLPQIHLKYFIYQRSQITVCGVFFLFTLAYQEPIVVVFFFVL